MMIDRSRLMRFLNAITPVQGAVFVSLSALVLRLGMWVFYGPVNYSDSASYKRLAGQILEGWINYDGSRVPGYPVFLAVFGSDKCVYLIQLMMGILITLGFFYIGWRITSRSWFGVLAAMIHQLNLGQLFFEANLLTETLATFLVMAALVSLVHGIYISAARRWWLGFIAGLASALGILTRPLFIFLPPWLMFWIILAWQDDPLPALSFQPLTDRVKSWLAFLLGCIQRQWLNAVAFAIPAAGLVGIWMGFIHLHYQDWALSTMTGYHLIQHTGAFFEYVPDEYAAIRDTYLQFRQARIAEFGTQANTIWYAIPEMQRASGLNFYDLSRILTKISIQLIRDHPGLFLRGVVDGWWLFWRAPVYWSSQSFHTALFSNQVFTSLMRVFVLLQRVLFFSANLFFIVSPLLIFFQWKVNRNENRRIDQRTIITWVILLGTVWFTSIVSSLLDHGDNPRFLIPLQTVNLIWCAWWIWQCLPPLTDGLHRRFLAQGHS